MSKKTAKWSLSAWVLVVVVILAAAFMYPKWEKKGTEATLSWDVAGYYLYLPAAIIYNDLGGLGFKDEVFKKYRPCDFYHAVQQPNGNWIMKYSIGMSVMYLPSFLAGHAYATLSPTYPADGFSYPYQVAIHWGSFLYAFLGLWIARKLLLRYFSDKTVAFTLLLLVLGTNYLNYVAFDSAMTHNYLFTIYTLIIYGTIRWYEKVTWGNSIALGFLIGLATIMRPTELIAVLIPIFWGLTALNKTTIIERLLLWQKHLPKLIAFTIVLIATGFIQLGYWKYYSGGWLNYSYGDQGFSFLRPHLKKGLLSFQKGWLIYTPIMIFAIFGFFTKQLRQKKLFWATVVFFLLNTYIVFSWDIWWYGGSYGQRAMVQSYAILLFPLAAFVAYIQQTNWAKYLVIGASLFFTWLNLMQTYQAHTGILHPEYMTRAYYWRIFGKFEIEKNDKKLLDTNEDFQAANFETQQLFFENFDTLSDTSQFAASGHAAASIGGNVEYSPIFQVYTKDLTDKAIDFANAEGWIRVKLKAYTPNKEHNIWKASQFFVELWDDSKVIKSKYIRIQRIIKAKKWFDVWVDVKMPTNKPIKSIRTYIRNAGSKKMLYLDDVDISHLKEITKN